MSGVWTPSIVSYTIPHYSAHELLVSAAWEMAQKRTHERHSTGVHALEHSHAHTCVERGSAKAGASTAWGPALPPCMPHPLHVAALVTPPPHLHCLVPAGRPQSHAVWRYLYVGHTVAMGTPHPHQSLLERGKGSGKGERQGMMQSTRPLNRSL